MQRDQKQRSHRDLSSRAAAILKGKAKNDVKRIDSETEAEAEAEASGGEASNMRKFDEVSTHINNLERVFHDLKRVALEEIKSSMSASQRHPRPTTSDSERRGNVKDKESLVELLDGDSEESGGPFSSESDVSLKAVYGNQSERGVNDHTVRESKIGQALRDSTNVPTSRHSSDMHRTHRGMRDNRSSRERRRHTPFEPKHLSKFSD